MIGKALIPTRMLSALEMISTVRSVGASSSPVRPFYSTWMDY
jgi:hypothetical protein